MSYTSTVKVVPDDGSHILNHNSLDQEHLDASNIVLTSNGINQSNWEAG